MAETARYSTIFCGFSSLMDIDKLILAEETKEAADSFSSLMDIDKLIRAGVRQCVGVVLVL